MLDKEIRQKIAELLASDITLSQFQEWFVPATWDAHQNGSREDLSVVGKVELWLAEISCGHLTDDEMQYEMRKFLNEPIRIVTGSSTRSTHQEIVFGSPTVVTSPPFATLAAAVRA